MMTDTTTATQTRRQRREAAENAARLDAKGRTIKTGRKVGVVLGTSGLILSSSVSAAAVEVAPADEGRALTTVALDAHGALERVSATQPTSITASENLQLTFERPAVSTESAPEPEPEPAPVAEPATTAETTTEAPGTEQAVTTEQPAETQQYDQYQQSNGESAATAEVETYEEQAPAANSSVVSTGYSVLGTPYVWAGSSLSGMDCSGFINWVYRQHGISLPRSTHGMLASLPRVSTPQPGDIVISTGIRSQYHAGIYAGNGQMLSSLGSTGVTTHGYHDGWHNVVAVLRPA